MPIINGTNGIDFINGTLGDDEIYGLDGGDFIDGGSGNDAIDAGAGQDVVHGDGGNDALFKQNRSKFSDLGPFFHANFVLKLLRGHELLSRAKLH